MDPLPLLAIVGLMFAGKQLSTKERYSGMPQDTGSITNETDLEGRSRQMYHLQSNDMGIDGGSAVKTAGPKEAFYGSGLGYMKKEVEGNFGDIRKDANRMPFGQPVYDLYNRQGITNKMNNLAPAEKMLVGPGLGVDPSIPAQGGFQQFFRVLPTNTNENRLTQLPGRSGPPEAAVKSAPPVQGALTQTQRPTKVYTRAPTLGKAQVDAPEGRPQFLRSERPSLKDQTLLQNDPLLFGPVQFQGVTSQDARDVTGNQIRGTDNRSKKVPGFMPAGNMNVRQDPLGMNGAISSMRRTTDDILLPLPPPDGGRFQNYVDAEMYNFNINKGARNPYAANLDLAQRQLKDNPLAFSISNA
ncbi:hypothetical protein EBT31_06320 [bacterium]|nr:hypothetical protein [bacterium]